MCLMYLIRKQSLTHLNFWLKSSIFVWMLAEGHPAGVSGFIQGAGFDHLEGNSFCRILRTQDFEHSWVHLCAKKCTHPVPHTLLHVSKGDLVMLISAPPPMCGLN